MPGDRSCVRTVHAVFEKDNARDFGIVARRKKGKPSVVTQVPLGVAGRRSLTGVRDHLRGAGLAGHVVAFDLGVVPGAGPVDDHEEAVANRLQLDGVGRSIGADGYASDAASAVDEALKLLAV